MIYQLFFLFFFLATEPSTKEASIFTGDVEADAVKDSTEINQVETITEMDKSDEITTLAEDGKVTTLTADVDIASEVDKIENTNTTNERVNEIDGEVTEKVSTASFTGKSVYFRTF